MTTLQVRLFKDSRDPFVQLLDEHKLAYRAREIRPGVIMAAGETLELIKVVGNVAIWASLAQVIVAFIKVRSSRKVIITLRDGTAVHAEGLNQKELEKVLEQARDFAAIDAGKD